MTEQFDPTTTPKCSELYDWQEINGTVSSQKWEFLALDLERELEVTKEKLKIALDTLKEIEGAGT